ncbi:hypothetical protein QQ008_15170 [Fulvivirgaceae bacterium BMA10]|uniref:Uncharacterized protein n=1 Tax=Splendidivirga corallicola TaxID=3051826 RepID=A0ABT8KSW1_9BACT|nr:hypothetical protein [Fulvivirgaceae bacterium BMA10]
MFNITETISTMVFYQLKYSSCSSITFVQKDKDIAIVSHSEKGWQQGFDLMAHAWEEQRKN